MTTVADRTGGTLGSLEALLARDVRDTEKHTGLSKVKDPALRLALDRFDALAPTNDAVLAFFPSLSALDLRAALNDAYLASRSPSAHGEDEHDPELDPEMLVAGDASGSLVHSTRLAAGIDIDAVRNLFFHGPGAGFQVWSSVALEGSMSIALPLVLPGRWAMADPGTGLGGTGARMRDIADELIEPAETSGTGSIDVILDPDEPEGVGVERVVAPDDRPDRGTVGVPDDGNAVGTVRALVSALDLPLRDVLNAADIRRSSFHSWDKANRPQPRMHSLGRLWALVQAVEDLGEILEIRLGRWLLADPRRHRALLEGRFDDLVEIATRATFPTRGYGPTGVTADSAVRPDDGSLLFEPRASAEGDDTETNAATGRPRRTVAGSQVVSRRRGGRRS